MSRTAAALAAVFYFATVSVVTAPPASAEPAHPSQEAVCENTKTRLWCDEPLLVSGYWTRCYRKATRIPDVGWKLGPWKCGMCGPGMAPEDGPSYHIPLQAKPRTR